MAAVNESDRVAAAGLYGTTESISIRDGKHFHQYPTYSAITGLYVFMLGLGP